MDKNLHPTMYLLIQIVNNVLVYAHDNLHPTMYLLIR